jgi:hypothetical protein
MAAKAERDPAVELAERIVKAAKRAALFSRARKVIVGKAVAEALGLEAGEHGAADLVAAGFGEEVAVWLEANAPGATS